MVELALYLTLITVLVIGLPESDKLKCGKYCQGDPISPMLFVIAMEALRAITIAATDEGVLSSFNGISAKQRLSIYADDVALFVRPTVQDLDFVRCALQVFGEASGLRVNYRKSSAILIHGNEEDR